MIYVLDLDLRTFALNLLLIVEYFRKKKWSCKCDESAKKLYLGKEKPRQRENQEKGRLVRRLINKN